MGGPSTEDKPRPRDAGSGWEAKGKDMGKEADWAWEEEGRPKTDRGRLPSSGRPCARPMELPMMDWYRESRPCRSGAAASPACPQHSLV